MELTSKNIIWRTKEMIAERNVNGYWIISDIIDGYLIRRVYIGYTKKEAIKLFKQEIRRMK